MVRTKIQNKRGGTEIQVDSVWNRRYSLPDPGINETGGINLDTETTSRSTMNLETTSSALPNSQLGTTKVGKPRQRMAWNKDMNIAVMRCYYIATEVETNLTCYRSKMFQLFKQEFPQLQVTEQRLADQRRLINTKSIIPDDLLNKLKQEVAIAIETTTNLSNREITNTEIVDQPEVGQVVVENMPSQPNTDNLSSTLKVENQFLEEQLINTLETFLIKYADIDPIVRPPIPRLPNTFKLINTAKQMDKILPKYIDRCESFSNIHSLIYCAALTCVQLNGGKIKNNNDPGKKFDNPPWQLRLEKKIENVRKDINKLTQYINGNSSAKLLKEINKIIRKTNIHTKFEEPNKGPRDILDTLKQKLTAWSKRLRRYKKCTQRKKENKLFTQSEGAFYRQLNQQKHKPNQSNKTELPTIEEINLFWSNLWSTKKNHNVDTAWIKKEIHESRKIIEMDTGKITIENFERVISKTHNWKSPGVDRIHNFWYKYFKNVHPQIMKYLNTFIENPQELPQFFTQGITYLLPKDTNDMRNPSKYRPITCLPTIYKILSGCICEMIYEHCESNKIITENQKGCIRNSMGCKEQLIIDKIILEQAHKKSRNIHTAYIDYRKAYDSVPHSWLLEILNIYKIHPSITNFLKTSMRCWNTQVKLCHGSQCLTSSPISINSGIFQGDALSPLWFILAMNPLSQMLNNCEKGFDIKNNNQSLYKISHLFYVDDLKLYSNSSTNLEQLINIVEMFSSDICMTFGLDKCRTQSISRGKLQKIDYILENEDIIKSMEENEFYTYLGIQQAKRVADQFVRDKIKEKYLKRIQTISKTLLNGKNMYKAINTYAIPVLIYTFGVLNWTTTEIEDLKRKTSVLLTKMRVHHPKSAIQRITLPRCKGGRGMLDIMNLEKKQILNLRTYFYDKQQSSILHNAIVSADRKYSPLNLSNKEESIILKTDEHKISDWNSKALHGKFPHSLMQQDIDMYASNQWLSHGGLFAETEGFMIAIQDQVIQTRNYQKYILKTGLQNDSCRKCFQAQENIQHITSGCTILTQVDYKNRHDNVAKIIYLELVSKFFGKNENPPYYKYTPAAVTENQHIRLYWDRGIITDKAVKHNRPDITLLIKNKICYLIDIAVPATTNLRSTYAEKIRKYTDLAIEVKNQWKIDKVITVPIIISAMAVIPTSLNKSLDKLNINQRIIPALQRSVILNTCNTVRKFLNEE